MHFMAMFHRKKSGLNTCLQVMAMVSNAHYLHRMTILGALAALAPAVAHDTLCNTMLPVVLSCATDKVPFMQGLLLTGLQPYIGTSDCHV